MRPRCRLSAALAGALVTMTAAAHADGLGPLEETLVEEAALQALAIAEAWTEGERARAAAQAACARAASTADDTAAVVVEVDRSGRFRFAGRTATGAVYRYTCTRRDGRVEARPLGR